MEKFKDEFNEGDSYGWADGRFEVRPSDRYPWLKTAKKYPWLLFDFQHPQTKKCPCRTLREAAAKRLELREKNHVPKDIKKGKLINHVLNGWGDTDYYRVTNINRTTGEITVVYDSDCPGR